MQVKKKLIIAVVDICNYLKLVSSLENFGGKPIDLSLFCDRILGPGDGPLLKNLGQHTGHFEENYFAI